MSRNALLSATAAIGVLLSALTYTDSAQAQKAPPLSSLERLGKALYFDARLSKNSNQSCATCHDAAVGYTGPDSAVNAHGGVYPGSDPALFGNRRPPSAAYAGDSPALRYDAALGWQGGMFWDGRADGSVLGDPLAEQAKGPFLNPLEMALSSAEELCVKVKTSSYATLFREVWGGTSLDCTMASLVYDQIGISIAAFERSSEVNPYSSKFDLFWDKAKARRLSVPLINAGNWTKYRALGLSDTELTGLAIFNDSNRANCASCHSLKPGSKGYPLFTDYSYRNLGVPKNPENPFYGNLEYNPLGANWVDIGLGGYLNSIEAPDAIQQMGKMKVPTLRNVDKRPTATFVKAYAHNGYFKSLSEIIRFYASRGMMSGGGMMGGGMMGGGMMGGGMMGGGGMGGMCGGMFPEPEVDQNLARLNSFGCRDQSYILAFLKTLSDGYFQR